MGKSINQVVLMGNMVRDPELRTTASGQSVLTISLAVNESYKNKEGNWEEKAHYIDVTAWAKLAENVANYTHRGSKVIVVGKLQSRAWEQDGIKKTKVEVLANDISFMDSKPAASNSQPAQASSVNTDEETINLDDIPF